MTQERWGTFSVIDHKDPAAFITEVLLYDRLVLPYPPNDAERKHWEDEGWNPKLMDKRLKSLGELALRANWDQDRQRKYDERMEQLKAVQNQAAVPWRVTAGILAEDPPKRPEGIRAIAVPAYQSVKGLDEDFIVKELSAESERSKLGLLLGHLLAVPTGADPEATLLKAIKLAKSDSFRKHRAKLYSWQDSVLREGMPAKDAAQEMAGMVKAYNDCVKKATGDVYYKFAFAIGGIALAITGAATANPWVAATGVLKIVEFATFNRKPVISAGEESAPAAMFHDVREAFGSRLRLT